MIKRRIKVWYLRLFKSIMQSRKSLRTKMIHGFVILIFCPMLLIILLSSYFYNYNNKVNYLNTLDVMINQAADKLSLYLEDMKYLAEGTLSNANIMKELHDNYINNQKYYIDLNSQEVLKSSIQSIMFYKKEIISVMIFDTSGRYKNQLRMSDKGIHPTFNPIQESWYRSIIDANGRTILLGKHALPLTDDSINVISIGKALRDYNGSFEPIAGILISLDIHELDHIFGQLNIVNGQRMIVVEREGCGVVYDSQAGEAIHEPLEEEIRAYLASGNDNHHLSMAGKPFVISYQSISGTDWVVVSVVPSDQLSTSNNKITFLATILMAICLLIALIIAVFFSLRITLPIKRLISTMKRVQQGNLEMQLRKGDKNEIYQISNEFNKMIRKINQLIKMLYIARLNQKEAELKALKLVIHPHFLFNTLESIHMMAELNNDKDTSIMIRKLGKFYRYYISESSDDTVSLKAELEHLMGYISLQQYRFGDRFLVTFNIPENMYEYRILKFIFQPIIENAIQHGFEQTMKDGLLKITGKIESNFVEFEVEDNGCGMTADNLSLLQQKLAGYIIEEVPAVKEETDHTGLGFANVNQRMKLYYGEEYGLSIRSEIGKGTTILIRFPNHNHNHINSLHSARQSSLTPENCP